MSCIHLRQLYQLCQDNNIRLTGADLVHMVCRECGVQDVCPAMLMEEYDATHPEEPQGDKPPAVPARSATM